jgi:hypothetical protein
LTDNLLLLNNFSHYYARQGNQYYEFVF